MRIYDITLTITPNLPVWPGDPPVVLERVLKIEDGASANVSRLDMGVHTGTHIDAPYHFIGDSVVTIEQLDLQVLTGPAVVLELPESVNIIDVDTLKSLDIPAGTERVLLKTRNSRYWQLGETNFQVDFVAINANGAEYLIERGIRLVGVDYLSVAPYSEGTPTHVALLKAGIIILEGLDLSQVPPGYYVLYSLPIKLGGADGAPARAILVETSTYSGAKLPEIGSV